MRARRWSRRVFAALVCLGGIGACLDFGAITGGGSADGGGAGADGQAFDAPTTGDATNDGSITVPPSCIGGGGGTCAGGAGDCCDSPIVPGGTFSRSNN